jgi:hypothetical protein
VINPVALLVGIWVVLLMLAAGGVGYALAHATAGRRILIAAFCGFTIIFGAAGTVLASAAYGRFGHPAGASANLTSPSANQASPPPAQVDPATPAEQYARPAKDAWLLFQSDTGDYIGAGKNEVWTLIESNFTLRGDSHDVQASVSGKRDWWSLEFRAPSDGTLQVGLFTNAERAPFVTGKAPGLDINGSGRGCNTLGGQFKVKSVRWGSTGEVTDIDVVFEQHCELGAAALRGELWISTQAGSHKSPPDLNAPIAL